MAPSFVFEPPSDEEYSEPEEQDFSDADDEEEEEQQQQQQAASVKPSRAAPQSPWDFAAYSETVADEHSRRNTTSVDDKITKARQKLSVPLPDPDDASSSGSESNKQVTT